MSAEPLFLPTHPAAHPALDLDRTVETAVVDLVAVRRSIGGMEEELRVLRQRIAAAEARDDGESPGSDFARRSTLLAHRMTTELLASGRADIRRAVEDAERSAAERVALAREDARRLLEGARRELAEALDQRSLIVDEVVGSATASVVEPPMASAPAEAAPHVPSADPAVGPPSSDGGEVAEILAELVGAGPGTRTGKPRRDWRKIELLSEMVVAAVVLVLLMITIR